MARTIMVGAAQMGPIARDEPRSSAVARMVALMESAQQRGCDLVVFPELALTTFFPRWYEEDWNVVDRFFETHMPNEATQPLFEAARRLGVGFHLGYAELCVEGRNPAPLQYGNHRRQARRYRGQVPQDPSAGTR